MAWWLAAAALVVAAGAWLVSTRSLPPPGARARRRGGHRPPGHAQHAGRAADGDRQRCRRETDAVGIAACARGFRSGDQGRSPLCPAYGALADTLAALAALAADQPKELLPLADAYARRAIELDPNHPLGWSALAQAHAQWTRNWVGAEAGFRRALALDPSTPSAAANLALLLAALNRPAEALEQAARRCNATPDRRGSRLRRASCTR